MERAESLEVGVELVEVAGGSVEVQHESPMLHKTRCAGALFS